MTDVTALPRLDLDKYLGRWYEICRLPIGWEDETATDITATYALNEDRNIRVDNRCFDEDGKPSRAIGEAVPVDDAKSRLKVTFLPEYVRWIPFTKGDYWVLKIDPPYRTALVGTPDRKYLWILSRQPQLAEATKVEYLDEARQQDFDLANLITPLHTGREVSDAMVEGSWPSRRPTSLAANKTCITIQKL
ncbi:lipocalin family protein [Mesorhizobium koreense]|uniref:lipocalin family protein n=1 Tax=Mesorhizobium koreense TaxID=3074855 RepID=UPI00287B62A9|nr:lipocalin family protein [Mesorhizobium sp. WR6]